MATVFHVTNFRNKLIDVLTGRSATQTPFGYINPYNGAMAADPSVTPAGSFVYSSYQYAPSLAGYLSTSSGGICQLSAARGPGTPAQAGTVSSLTFARIYNTASTPMFDTSVSLAGGGGGVILDGLSSSAGVGVGVVAAGFSFKLPSSNGGTFLLGASLMNRLVDGLSGVNTASPYMGINTSGSSVLTLYSGSAPATADAPATGTLLLSLPIGATNIWNAASGGAASLAVPLSGTAAGTGTGGYARVTKTLGNDTFVFQGGVSETAGDFVFDTLTLESGVTTVRLIECTLSI